MGDGTNVSASLRWPQEVQGLWWRGGPEVDGQVKERFSADIEAIAAGQREDWGSPEATNPLNTLAGIILCDQFTR